MAKDPSKTERATPRRREKAREEGQVARSQDIPIATTLLSVFLILLFYIPFAKNILMDYFGALLSDPIYFFIEANHQTVTYTIKTITLLVGPVFAVLLIVGVASNIAQFGFLFTLKPLMPKLDKINPISGLQRLLSPKTLFELFRNLLKLAIATAIAYFLVRYLLEDVMRLAAVSIAEEAYFLIRYTMILILAFAILSIPIAAADFFYRRFEYEESIKMTKYEIKEEQKLYEGHPLIKSAIRKKQREISMRRMMAEVAKADVVITNPKHFAVALAYERGKMEAPKVVAKGQDHVAQKIKEIAIKNGVRIEENPPLARSLYQACEIGDFIPENLYAAIAKILARIYKEKGA